jgi:glyoxylase-like metal-dependent hydrolase (beta-lactamase superfamily II)
MPNFDQPPVFGSKPPRAGTAAILFALALGPAACGDDGSATESDTDGSSTGDDAPSSTTTGADAGTPSATDETTATTTAEETGSDSTTSGDTDALDRIYTFIGGRDALSELAGFALTLAGDRFVHLEGFTPEDPPVPANTFDATLSYDLESDRLRLTTTRTLAAFAPGTVQAFDEIIDGELGYLQGNESALGLPSGDMESSRWAATRRQQYLLNPHLPLRTAVADPSLATVVGTEDIDGTTYDVVEVADPVHALRLYADPATGEPKLLVTLENDHMLRDAELVVTYDDWQPDDNGIRFPAHVTLSLAGNIVLDETREAVALDPRFGRDLFAFPRGAAPVFVPAEAERGLRSHQFHHLFSSLGLPFDALQDFVLPEELSPGVFYVTGGSHHSVLVEQESGLVLVEAPLYPERSRAIMQWAEDAFPDKSITHVVITHFHMDHAAGAREVLAGGATLVVGEASAAFWGEILDAPSLVVPDALAENPVDVPVELVAIGGSFIIDDPVNPVGVYAITNNTHATDLVLAHVEAAEAVFTSDIYSPGLPGSPIGAGEFYDAIVEHGLDASVSAVLGGHGFEVHTLDQLEAAAGGG